MVYETMPDARLDALTETVKEHIWSLRDIAHSAPRKAIVELLSLIEQYPDVPVLLNYLYLAYILLGDLARAEQVADETLRRHPNYLFGRLSKATLCLDRGGYRGFADALNHKFDLAQLYPDRRRFHVSEFVGFVGLMGPTTFGPGTWQAHGPPTTRSCRSLPTMRQRPCCTGNSTPAPSCNRFRASARRFIDGRDEGLSFAIKA